MLISNIVILLVLLSNNVKSYDYNETLSLQSVYLAGSAYCYIPVQNDIITIDSNNTVSNTYIHDKLFRGTISSQSIYNDYDVQLERTDCYNKSTHIYGFTGIFEDYIIISFRGTNGIDITNWIMNFDIQLVSFFNYPGKIHYGFVHDYMSIRSEIIDSVQQLIDKYPNKHILINGHSLGGALAVLCALDLLNMNITRKIQLYSFGQPRIGNQEFAINTQQLINENFTYFRVTNINDIVPQMPPLYFDFKHFGSEIWYPNGTFNQYEICDKQLFIQYSLRQFSESTKCIDSVYSFGIFAHTTYLNVPITSLCKKSTYNQYNLNIQRYNIQ